MYQYVFFDLDGTLTDSKEGVLECVRYAIEGMGRPVPEGDLLKFIGPPLQDSFMRYCGLSQEESRRALELFRERYVPVGQFKNRPAPGMAEMMPAAIVMATVAEPTQMRTRAATINAMMTIGRLAEETAFPMTSPSPEYWSI